MSNDTVVLKDGITDAEAEQFLQAMCDKVNRKPYQPDEWLEAQVLRAPSHDYFFAKLKNDGATVFIHRSVVAAQTSGHRHLTPGEHVRVRVKPNEKRRECWQAVECIAPTRSQPYKERGRVTIVWAKTQVASVKRDCGCDIKVKPQQPIQQEVGERVEVGDFKIISGNWVARSIVTIVGERR